MEEEKREATLIREQRKTDYECRGTLEEVLNIILLNMMVEENLFGKHLVIGFGVTTVMILVFAPSARYQTSW